MNLDSDLSPLRKKAEGYETAVHTIANQKGHKRTLHGIGLHEKDLALIRHEGLFMDEEDS